MEQSDTRFQDEKIIETINYYNNLNKFVGFAKYQTALDSIAETIGQMPFVIELRYNSCQENILTFPGHIILGVRFDTNKGQVEKCYKIQLGIMPKTKLEKQENYNYLKFISSYIEPRFIEREKIKCGERSNKDEQK